MSSLLRSSLRHPHAIVFRHPHWTHLGLRWTSHSAPKRSVTSADSNTPKRAAEKEAPYAIRHLLQTVEDFLQSGKPGVAIKYFQREATTALIDNPTRFLAYERSISLFLRHRYPLAAAMVFGRMTREGFIPSVSIRTQMAIIVMVERSSDEKVLREAMQGLFCQKSFDECCLRDIFHLLINCLNGSPDFIDKVADTFIATRESGFTLSEETINLLVTFHSRSGSSGTAQHWISRFTENASEKDKQEMSYPYTTLLRDLVKSAPKEYTIYQWIVENVEAAGVVPDLPFYNALIATEVAHRRYNRAFAVYGLLWEHRTPNITPDAYTYASLFRALRMIHRQRNLRTRKHPRPRDARSPRQLYHEMLDCHFMRTDFQLSKPSPVISADVLHSALRTFMLTNDFPAAFLVLRTLRGCKIVPTLQTYRLIVGSLALIVKKELPLISRAHVPEDHWSYRFLGLASYPDQTIDVDLHLLEMILRIGTEPKLSLRYIPLPDESGRTIDRQNTSGDQFGGKNVSASSAQAKKYRKPSAITLVGLEEMDPDTPYDMTPLERILRRAVLATRRFVDYSPAREVTIKIVEAKSEMFDCKDERKRKQRYVRYHGKPSW